MREDGQECIAIPVMKFVPFPVPELFSLTTFQSTNLKMLPNSCRKIISRKGWHLIYFPHPILSSCGFGCKTASLKLREVSSAPRDSVQTIEHVWRKGLFFGSLNSCSCQFLSSYGQTDSLWFMAGSWVQKYLEFFKEI